MNAQPPPWAPGQAPPGKKGFPTWLLVLLIVGGGFFLVVPIMASLAIYGVRKYIATAKTAEARSSLGQIAKDAVSAYETERATSRGTAGHRLCPSASQSVPASVASVKGVKYQSSPDEWTIDASRNAGFACLRFSMNMPQYYSYAYRATGGSAPGDSFEAAAHGDLNGDGVTSELRLGGTIGPDKSVTVAPTLTETDPQE